MAKEAKAAAESAEAPAAPKKSKKLLIIILATILVLGLIAGGSAVLLLKGDDEADDEDVAETTQTKKAKKGKEMPPTFVNLESFTVNLVPETGDQYLQVTLAVEFEEPTAEQLVKLHMPKIRNNVTLLLSGKKPSELLSKEGKEKLAAELLDTVNDVLDPPKGSKRSEERPAKAVLFTSFIVQ